MGDESILVQEDDELMVHYLVYTEKSVEELRALVERLKDDENPAKLTDEMHAIAHNIKGMGSSFGFPLMTRVGSTLSSYLLALNTRKADADILQAHLKAIDTILGNRILGDGGAAGEKLVSRLNEIISS